ncbi:MAG: NAD(P)H-binding protein [Longimicrobiales bacterium]|nr:NAD(P)H-binding protein [Longimicrobiales bacterium]
MNAGARQVVVLGGTGLVGGHLVDMLVSDPGVARVVAPLRRPEERSAATEKVVTPVVDFDEVDRTPEAFEGSQLFICLGTTLRKAGSREAFRRVDLVAVVDAARLAVAAGARDVLFVSSAGADPGSRGFYLRVKGEAEAALCSLPFQSIHVFRPSILTGDRGESRPAERAGIFLATLATPLMVGRARRYRPIAGATVARAMARAARAPGAGPHVWESEQIAELGA